MTAKTLMGALTLAVAAAAAAAPAAAQITIQGATTLASPTFNRTLAGDPPTGLSGVGTAAHHSDLALSVGSSGSYSFVMDSGTGGFDTFLSLYTSSFNPSAPLSNVLVANDDLAASLIRSGFTRTLTAGTNYTAVSTGFANTDVGNYSLTVTNTAAPTVTDITLSGMTTLASPTFNRTLAGNPPSGLSGVGAAVHYNVIGFSVATGGDYSFLMDSGTGGFDTFLSLYTSSFNPSSSLSNILVANDDLAGSLTQSGFTRTLTAGTTYFAVLTGFANTDVGSYSLRISSVNTAVPEPATWGLMIVGFGAVGAMLRRRSAARTVVRFA